MPLHEAGNPVLVATVHSKPIRVEKSSERVCVCVCVCVCGGVWGWGVGREGGNTERRRQVPRSKELGSKIYRTNLFDFFFLLLPIIIPQINAPSHFSSFCVSASSFFFSPIFYRLTVV